MRKSTKRKPVDYGARLLRTMPWKIAAVFMPLERIVEQIEREGTIDYSQAIREPVFRDMNDGKLYAIPAALDGVCDLYVVLSGRTGRAYPIDPIKQLAAKLRYGSPIFPEDLQRVKDSLAELRAAAGLLTQNEAVELTKITEIRANMPESLAP